MTGDPDQPLRWKVDAEHRRPRHDDGKRGNVGLFDKLMHLGEGRSIKRLEAIAKQVNHIEPDFEAMDDEELRGQTADFRQRLDNGQQLDALLPEAFGSVLEASKRVLG